MGRISVVMFFVFESLFIHSFNVSDVVCNRPPLFVQLGVFAVCAFVFLRVVTAIIMSFIFCFPPLPVSLRRALVFAFDILKSVQICNEQVKLPLRSTVR